LNAVSVACAWFLAAGFAGADGDNADATISAQAPTSDQRFDTSCTPRDVELLKLAANAKRV
jgi:hypothetical protein